MIIIKLILVLVGIFGTALAGLLVYVVESRGGTVLQEILAVLILLVGITALGLLGVIDATERRES